jgi:oxalate decarboxylase/phosphoglucose isomerase-like protein (cupin superfamily)
VKNTLRGSHLVNTRLRRNNSFRLENYRLQTNQDVMPVIVESVGTAHMIDKDIFPALEGVTCYAVEIWEECMRLPHWHPNASELGYVISGTIEVIIWRSPGETAVFTLSAGMCWFIPQAALHSLNNIGTEHAALLVGFSSDQPQDIDLPVAFNGIPISIRTAYTPHAELRQWSGVIANPLLGRYHLRQSRLQELTTGSPYRFDFAKVTPLFRDANLGSVVWGIKSNWSILQDIAILRAHLKPGVARDAIWYPDAGTLYIVSKGKGQFHIIIADQEPSPLDVQFYDYIFVPAGVLHTFTNTNTEDFEVTAFFTKADPQPEVSLSVASAFFPHAVSRAAMTEYANEHKVGDPLKDLQHTTVSPYLLRIS